MIKAASGFNPHLRKQVVRSLWCKPHLKILHELVKKKLIYIGLPDIQALDIKEWLDYIEKVFAFQCSIYNGQTIEVKILEEYLKKLELTNKIKSSVVYIGWMEDIVLGKISENGYQFNQSDFFKIYNLDFCNNLRTPREIFNSKGKRIEVIHKLDLIDKLLKHQSEQEDKGANFIMYLTVNANTFESDDNASIKTKEIRKYLKKIDAIRKPEVKAIRQIKAHGFYHIVRCFNDNGFHAELLPPVFYHGSLYPNKEKSFKPEHHRMMTFTILGTKIKKDESSFVQDAEVFLNQQFIFANDTSISCYNDAYINEQVYNADVIELLKNSHTYNNLWT